MGKQHQEWGRKGGIATLARHGVDHFRRIQALSWQKQIAADPRANFRLGYAGLRSMDTDPQNGAWTGNQYDPNRRGKGGRDEL